MQWLLSFIISFFRLCNFNLKSRIMSSEYLMHVPFSCKLQFVCIKPIFIIGMLSHLPSKIQLQFYEHKSDWMQPKIVFLLAYLYVKFLYIFGYFHNFTWKWERWGNSLLLEINKIYFIHLLSLQIKAWFHIQSVIINAFTLYDIKFSYLIIATTVMYCRLSKFYWIIRTLFPHTGIY